MRSIEQIIDSQLERWAVERRAAEEAAKRGGRRSETPREVRPWIAISRDYGAGGSAIAESLAEQLGYELFDRKLLDALARESRYRREFLASVDEKGRSTLEAHVDALLHGESFVRSDFLRYLMRVLMTIAEHGHAVVVGRGAAHVLPAEGGVTVRIVAPLEDRVQNVARRLALPQVEARLRVHEVDRARADFLRTHFHRAEWRPEDHDLTICTSRIPHVEAVHLVESALIARFPKEHRRLEKTG
ncbi:MAG: cytidylate kinase-like family protein [Candidatus Eisenbacteria bacterium]